MAGVGLRLLMAAVGLCLLAVYLALAALAALAIQLLASLAVDPLTVLVAVVGGSLLAGVASYVLGAWHLLATLDAHPLDPRRGPDAYRRLDRLVAEMDVGDPQLLVARLGEPNAFSVRGPRRSAVVVDPSLFGLLTAEEFEAVLAHELAHLETADALVQTLAYGLVRTLVGVLVLLALPAILVVTGAARALAWIRGRPTGWSRTLPARVRAAIEVVLLQVLLALTVAVRAHARRREFAADRRAAAVTGQPLALARALHAIERATRSGHGPLSTLYVRGEDDDPLADLFATHPDTAERIERLRELAGDRRRRIPAQ